MRLTELSKHPPNSTCIQPVEEKCEDPSDHDLVEELLSVEVGFRAIHISVPKASSNDNGSILTIVLASLPVAQSPSMQ